MFFNDKRTVRKVPLGLVPSTIGMILWSLFSPNSSWAENRSETSKFITIPIFYLTDRQMTGETYGPRRRYPNDCQHRMYYGTAFVQVPNAEHKRQAEIPRALGWTITDKKAPKISLKEKIAPDAEEDLESAEKIESVENSEASELTELQKGETSKAKFIEKLEKSLDSSKPELSVFVHGAADGFEDCLQDAAILAYYLKKPMILYSWPSDPRWRGYFIDGSNSEYSQQHFNTFCKDLLTLRDKHSFKTIFLAHSMGNRLLVRALPVIAGTHLASSYELISPDIDTDTCKHYVMGYKNGDAKIRLYVSNRDKMLPLSQLLAGGYYRLGEPAKEAALPGTWLKDSRRANFERIDFTTVDTGFYGHKLPSALVGSLVNSGEPPVGYRLVDQKSVEANTFAKFAGRSEKFKAKATGLSPLYCRCVIKDGAKQRIQSR